MTNKTNSVLYVGVTGNLMQRVSQHVSGRGSVFSSKYNCVKLVYYEVFQDMTQAIAREKQLKHYKREWKNNLIESINPGWEDLWFSLMNNPLG